MCRSCNSAGQCQTCYYGYYLENSLCTDNCTLGTYPNTLTGSCTVCDPYCSECAGPRRCTVCALGYYLYSGVCYASCPVGTVASTSQPN